MVLGRTGGAIRHIDQPSLSYLGTRDEPGWPEPRRCMSPGAGPLATKTPAPD